MTDEPPDPATLLHRLREQMLLVQVRLMEFEDERAALRQQLADERALTAQAQALADAQLEALHHLERTHAALEAEFQHLRHVQHVTNLALEETRRELAAARDDTRREAAALAEARAQLAALERELAAATARGKEDAVRLAAREASLEDLRAQATGLANRVAQLDAERRALLASRSWRWTAPLRAVERWWAHRRG